MVVLFVERIGSAGNLCCTFPDSAGWDSIDLGRQMAGIERGRDGAGLARRRKRAVLYQYLSGHPDVCHRQHHQRPFSNEILPNLFSTSTPIRS